MIINELAESIALTGAWAFSLGNDSLQGTIQVPGCWEAQGYSKFVDGPAYYQRKVHIPGAWSGHRILVEFEAVSYACEISFNGIPVGEHRGLWTPFVVDLTDSARPGEENTLALVVYKPGERFPMRSTLAGFLPDVATTFGGIWQPAHLRALKAGMDELHIPPDVERGGVQLSCRAVTYDFPVSDGQWEIIVSDGERNVAEILLPLASDGKLNTFLPIQDPILWGPVHPHLYTLHIRLLEAGTPIAQVSRRVGFRWMTTRGDQLLYNDEPLMVRGILSWGWEPQRIAPNYTPEQARGEMRRVRQLGFNLVKLCLFVPNQVYFEIADQEGMLLWLELPMWLPQITPAMHETIKAEYAAMTRLALDHPSVVLYSLGCELSQVVGGRLLEDLNTVVRDLVTGVLVCDNSGSGESYGGLDFDFSDFTDYHPYCDIHYFEALLDNWRRDWQSPRPWIFGEFCDSDTFRDINEMIACNGGERPWWMTRDNPVTTWRPESLAMMEQESRLQQAQPGFSPQEIVEISYAQSFVERKYILESLRRRRGIGGYVLTGLLDTPISTSGIWDDLGRLKWDPAQFLPINGEAVLSLDVTRKRRWHHGGDRPDRLDVFNHLTGTTVRWNVILFFAGKDHFKGGTWSWSLVHSDGTVICSGSEEVIQEMQPGVPQELGRITCALPLVHKGTEYCLAISLGNHGSVVANHWPIWVYPEMPTPPAGMGIYDPMGQLLVGEEWFSGVPAIQNVRDFPRVGLILTPVLDEALLRFVKKGGKLLLLHQGSGPLPIRHCPFWRESIILFPEHPLWDSFPHCGYAGMQFFSTATDIAFDSSQLANSLPGLNALAPMMRRLDARQFHMSEYLFEARVGLGTLIGCSLRLQGGMGVQPHGMKRNIAGSALLSMILAYLGNMEHLE